MEYGSEKGVVELKYYSDNANGSKINAHDYVSHFIQIYLMGLNQYKDTFLHTCTGISIVEFFIIWLRQHFHTESGPRYL